MGIIRVMHSFFDRLMFPSIGYLYVGAAATLWASAGLMGAVASGIPASALAAVRALSGGIALCLFIGPKAIRTLDFRSSWPAVLETSAYLALFQWTFFTSVALAGASMASIASTAVAPLAADGIGFFRRSIAPSKQWLMSGMVSIIGLLLPVFNGTPAWGMASAAIAGSSYAAYTIAAARLERAAGTTSAGLTATAVAFAGASIVLLPAVLPHLVSLISLRALLIALYLGFATTALAYALFVRSLRHLSPSRALNAAFVQPLAAMALARMVTGEQIDRFTVAALGIFGLSILLRTSLPWQPAWKTE